MFMILFFVVVSFLFIYILNYDFRTKEIIVAIVDTGINEEHNLFKGRIISSIDLTNLKFESEDENGHGSHVAGIVAQMVPEVKFISVRKFNKKGKSINPFSGIGIFYAIFKGADIINMSFQTTKFDFLTRLAIKFGNAKNVIFVSSAGNEGEDTITFPANLEEVISVGVYDEEENDIFKYSNFGKEINFLAPGVNIKSAYVNKGIDNLGSLTIGFHNFYENNEEKIKKNIYSYKSGTSMASAYITGVIAYIKLKKKNQNKKEIVRLLNENAFKIESENKYTYNVVDFELINAYLEKKPYLKIFEQGNYSKNETLELNFIENNLKDITVFYENIWENIEKPIKGNKIILPLEEGVNRYLIRGIGEQEKIIKEIAYVRDTSPPEIIIKKNKNKTTIEITDITLKSLKLNDTEIPYSFKRRGRLLKKVWESEINLKKFEFPLKVEVIDKLENKTIKYFEE